MTQGSMVRLAKPSLDICLFTNNAAPLVAFWRDEIGLVPDDPIQIREGLMQHRLGCGKAVIKISEMAEPLPASPPCGYRELLIAGPGTRRSREAMVDPDGNRVRFVEDPSRRAGVGVDLHVRDLAATRHFYAAVLGLPVTDGPSVQIEIGDSRLCLVHDPEAVADPPVEAPGWRYITLQIYDARGLYASVMARGGRPGRPPRRLGDIARFALIRDPDGNWIELTQRASLTGPLGPD
jgi:catechol 2,3-dioxygenase-like lactoylglutathione lyase family enzyme